MTFDVEKHKTKWEPKLWVMFDRARRDHPEDFLLAYSILMEIYRLGTDNVEVSGKQ